MKTIERLLLEDDASFGQYTIQTEDNIRALGSLSVINLFVGANNSGKSRFMRQLARIKPLKFLPRGPVDEMRQIRGRFYQEIAAIYKQFGVVEMSGPFPNLAAIPEVDVAVEGEPYGARVIQLIEKAAAATNVGEVGYSYRGGYNPQQVFTRVTSLARDLLPQAQALSTAFPARGEISRIYFPTLRGLRRFPDGSDLYEQRTRSDYFENIKHVSIFTGLTLYEDLKRLLLGTLEDREVVADFQRFLSKAFFQGEPIALIPRHDSTDLHVKIGTETEYPIRNLGDGIQSIIILTFPLFRARGQELLGFFEEPELFLHPGLQRLFLNTLLHTEGFERFQYFVASHSNHFLDLTLDIGDISIFTFRKELEEADKKERAARFAVENVSNEDDRTLQLLGVTNSSIFFSNCTIWVEGFTDRRYLSHYLRLYESWLDEEALRSNSLPGPRYKQDLHYSFVEYGGGNITHWSFLDSENEPIIVERLCAKLLLITDKDDPDDKAKAARQAALQRKLGDRYVCLSRREIENLLSPDVILKVVREFEGTEAQLANVRYETYADEPLGRFIETRVLKEPRKRRGSYAAESGTVANKVDFCTRSLKHLTRFDDLSVDAKTLTQKLHQFIAAHNPGVSG